jgi:hypothetical protein|tara:strand:- start:912 stop:1799 length:888 start_codon:yes stop_codon:yes gene_type:complete
MTVFLGNSGVVKLRRSTPAATFASTIDPGDVNAAKKRFSFDFPQEMLVTGDRLQIASTNGADLAFIDASGWDGGSQLPDGAWYVNVDELGGICLYDTFSNALNGGNTGKISLATISTAIPVEVKSVQAEYNVLGLVRSFELNNDREVADVTALSDEFRKNESGLISGSGSIECMFHYNPTIAKLPVDSDVPSYLHELLLRQKLGAEFDAELYIIETGNNFTRSGDQFYFEFKGIVTNAAIGLGTNDLVLSNFNFVTTGPITPKLGRGIVTRYVLKEDTDRILLEQPGSGKLELED